MAPIICENCGTDYAREYWLTGISADPLVCNSCRRDTNPDAADFPRWVKADTVAEIAREFPVTAGQKQCRTCGGQWDGLFFGPSPSKGSPLPFGICPACAVADDARHAPVVSFGMPLRGAR